jgi:hypothetical protein
VTTAELTVIAALGASFLTGLASLGVVAFQEWRRRAAGERDALQAAVVELLARSLQLALRGDTMRVMMKVRSGLKEGLQVTMRHRVPVDPMQLHDWMAQDWTPLNSALSEIAPCRRYGPAGTRKAFASPMTSQSRRANCSARAPLPRRLGQPWKGSGYGPPVSAGHRR